MRIVFMGTPDFAVPSLVSLVEAGNEIALVVLVLMLFVGVVRSLSRLLLRLKRLSLVCPLLRLIV